MGNRKSFGEEKSQEKNLGEIQFSKLMKYTIWKIINKTYVITMYTLVILI